MAMTAEEKTKFLLPTLYSGAGQELAQRIHTRELVLVSYVGLSATLLGIAAAYEAARLLALAVPFLAVACALLSAHHDAIIGLLSKYMGELSQDVEVVRWHDKTGYLGEALVARSIRDAASFVYLLFTVLASLYVSRLALLSRDPGSPVVGVWWVGWLCVPIVVVAYALLWCFRAQKWPFR